jgi:hypothetical protein
MVLGGSDDDQNRVASIFNCNIGCLPMKYLGVLVNSRHMCWLLIWQLFIKKLKRSYQLGRVWDILLREVYFNSVLS